VYGIGHSLGGAVIVSQELQKGGTFNGGMVLLEPMILPSSDVRDEKGEKKAASTEKRRWTW